jgi:endonuclease YncB( thermonuclease family)
MGACVSLTRPQVVTRPQSPPVHNEMVAVERPPVTPNKIQQLKNLDPKLVPKVPMQNELIDARIVDIYDGDTVKVIVLFGEVPFFISLRILGVDAPEIRKAKDKLPEESVAGIKVREHVKSLFPTNIAKVTFRDWDKYGGRILGDIYTPDGISIAEHLIAEGWVRRYNGEKKKEWTLQELVSHPFA